MNKTDKKISLKTHWEQIYESKDDSQMSWYQPLAENSLKLIAKTGLQPSAKIIDVGGGNSVLVKDLLEKGFEHISVLDISQKAIERSQHQLGADSKKIEWIVDDVKNVSLKTGEYDLWHDRAVFHFFTEETDRKGYVSQLQKAVKQKGFVIIAAFCLVGPEKCSGLPVRRYDPMLLAKELGKEFKLIEAIEEPHHTPWGSEQCFVYVLFQKNS